MLLWLLGIVSLKAQSISKAEYFFDTDPGVSKGTALTVTPSGAISATYAISTGSLSPGMHKLFVRFGFSTGEWGPAEGDIFYIDAHPIDTGLTIQSLEYFYDRDPAPGKGTSVTVTPSGNISTNISLPTTVLSKGWHNAYIRSRYSNGEYGFFTGTSFVIKNDDLIFNGAITKLEFYIDGKDGKPNNSPLGFFGNGNNINIPFSPVKVDSVRASDSFTFDNSITGIHTITVQAKNSFGTWSKDSTRSFTVGSVGIEKENHSETISIYPNPVKDYLYLDGTMKSIYLTDLNGKILISNNSYSAKQKLDLSSLNSGVYILRIFTGDAVECKKVIKE